MSAADILKLVLLSAVWGGSFIFLRITVPELGPLLTTTLRTSLAGVGLMAYVALAGINMDWRRNLTPYALVGLFAGVVPFTGFSFAALHLPAAYLAVLNSTAPLFGALFSVIWLAERMTLRKLAGLALGVAGVAILVGAGTVPINRHTLVSFLVCLMAGASYALSSIIVKKTGSPGGIHPIAMATGSMVLGGVIMMPVAPFAVPPAMPSLLALACITALALVSSGLAQAIFIPMIIRIGPTRAMTVSFLIPLFSMIWGILFLHEPVRASTLAGAGIVLAAMGLVLSASHPSPQETISSKDRHADEPEQ